MNSLSELLFGPLNLPAPLSGHAPDGSALPQAGGFAQTLTDARTALDLPMPADGSAGVLQAAVPVDRQGPGLPGTEAPLPWETPPPWERPPGRESSRLAFENPSSLPGVQPLAADPALGGAAPPATLPGLPLRLAVRATTTEGTGQGSPGGNGLPPLGPDGGKALPDLPPARVQPHPASAGADAAAAAGKGVAATPDGAAAAVVASAVAQRPGVPTQTGVPVAQTPTPTTTHIDPRVTSGLAATPAAEAVVVARAAPTLAEPNAPTQSHLPGATTATTGSLPQSGPSAPQASAAPASTATASASASAAPPTAPPEGLAERTAAAGQPGDVARQLGAVELRALDPTAQGAADARRPAGADLLNPGQPGLRQDMATQVDSGMAAAVIDRRTIVEAAGQRRGAEQQAAAGAESVDRSPSTGTEAAEQISRPQTARPVVPVLAARDMSALAERIEMLMHRRSGVANVNLTLSELGDVEISVRMESKQAHVQFLVQDAAARESLEAQLPRLRALLSEGGLELGDIGMNMRERSGGDGGGERGDEPTGTPGGAVADDGSVEEPSPRRRSGGGDHVLDAFA